MAIPAVAIDINIVSNLIKSRKDGNWLKVND